MKIQRIPGIKKKIWLVGLLIFAVLSFGAFGGFSVTQSAYAEPENGATEQNTTTTDGAANRNKKVNQNDNAGQNNETTDAEDGKESEGGGCKQMLGALGGIVCPVLNTIGRGVDWTLGKIESILQINPVAGAMNWLEGVLQIDPTSVQGDSAIHKVWEYVRNVTNIVFIGFFLVVIYSQITGYGISNYGIKKSLPKMILVAILINLSYLICVVAIDVSNVLGNGLRGVFSSIQEAVLSSNEIPVNEGVTMGEVVKAVVLGGGLAVGGVTIAIEYGLIFMVIPTLLGGLVSAVAGFVTITLRQAVVALLVMISPLAFVAYMLPNTEDWFKRWKKLFTQMLTFYPAFSLLFGASNLASFAIMSTGIANKDAFWIVLALAVRVFPLFYSLKLMKMSGTFLEGINAKLQGLAATPLATNRAWADSHRRLSMSRALESGVTPSARLLQYLSDRKVAREEETEESMGTVKKRGQFYAARSNYRRNGVPSSKGERAAARQALNMRYQSMIETHKVNMDEGFSTLEAVERYASPSKKERLKQLDLENVKASDALHMIASRGAEVDRANARGYFKRTKDAMYAKEDDDALVSGNTKHQMHHGVLDDESNLARYYEMKKIMNGKDEGTQYIVSDAAYSFSAKSRIARSKFAEHFRYFEGTQNITDEMNKITKTAKSKDNLEFVEAGLEILADRGDTDLVEEQIENLLQYGNFEIGSNALQELSKYCLFDMKGRDPAIRRLGKHINLETARMFNEDDPAKRRTRRDISLHEYVTGEYVDRDAEGRIIYNEDGTPKIAKTKMKLSDSLRGTSYADIERTGFKSQRQLFRENSGDILIDDDDNESIQFNYEKFKNTESEIWDAIFPNVIGDHFGYKSGSEQLIAFGKELTGIDLAHHKFDLKYLFGKDHFSEVPPEKVRDYIGFKGELMKKFLGGQTASQIAKEKSDMLNYIKHLYAFQEALNEDPAYLEKLSDPNFEMSDEQYKRFEKEHMPGIRKRFKDSFKKSTLERFVSMDLSGHSGESKDGLYQLFDMDELYREFFPNGVGKVRDGRRRGRDSVNDVRDDDDSVDPESEYKDEAYNGIKINLDAILNNYRGGKRLKVREFWEEVKSVINNSEIRRIEELINSTEASLSEYTDVEVFYQDLLARLKNYI